MENQTALVVGSTGLIGNLLLTLLLEDARYAQVVTLVRRSGQMQHSKLKEIVCDFNTIDFTDYSFSIDHVFCCLGTTMAKAKTKEQFTQVDYHLPMKVAHAALVWGAKSFLLVSAMGANPGSIFFYNKVKGRLEADIKGIGLPRLHIFRPSLLLGDRDEKRPGEDFSKIIFKYLNFLFFGPFKNYAGIHAGKVASAMLVHAFSTEKGAVVHDSSELQNYEI